MSRDPAPLDSSDPLTRWDRLDRLHRWYAELDAPDPRPHLAAFAGDEGLVVIGLRPFAPQGYRGPLVEAMALALPLGADRVSVALPGRAWSLDDPVAPVTDDADLRQRVLTQVAVDGHARVEPRVTTRLHPFFASPPPASGLTWLDPVDPGPGEGWIPRALATLVEGRGDIRRDARPEQLARQVVRLHELGHEVLLPRDAVGAFPP